MLAQRRSPRSRAWLCSAGERWASAAHPWKRTCATDSGRKRRCAQRRTLRRCAAPAGKRRGGPWLALGPERGLVTQARACWLRGLDRPGRDARTADERLGRDGGRTRCKHAREEEQQEERAATSEVWKLKVRESARLGLPREQAERAQDGRAPHADVGKSGASGVQQPLAERDRRGSTDSAPPVLWQQQALCELLPGAAPAAQARAGTASVPNRTSKAAVRGASDGERDERGARRRRRRVWLEGVEEVRR